MCLQCGAREPRGWGWLTCTVRGTGSRHPALHLTPGTPCSGARAATAPCTSIDLQGSSKLTTWPPCRAAQVTTGGYALTFPLRPPQVSRGLRRDVRRRGNAGSDCLAPRRSRGCQALPRPTYLPPACRCRAPSCPPHAWASRLLGSYPAPASLPFQHVHPPTQPSNHQTTQPLQGWQPGDAPSAAGAGAGGADVALGSDDTKMNLWSTAYRWERAGGGKGTASACGQLGRWKYRQIWLHGTAAAAVRCTRLNPCAAMRPCRPLPPSWPPPAIRLDKGPLLPGCGCFACARHSRAYVHHLLNAHEMLGEVLLEAHNTSHMNGFCQVRGRGRGLEGQRGLGRGLRGAGLLAKVVRGARPGQQQASGGGSGRLPQHA